MHDANELTQCEPLALTELVAQWGLSEEGQRAWGKAPAPTEDDVAAWIERAKRAQKDPAKSKSAA